MRRSIRHALSLAAPALLLLASAPADVRAGSVRDTIERVQPRVVKIFGAGGIRRLHAYGTGFLVTPEGHIATVWSHVLDEDEVTVVLDDGRKFEARVLGAEPQLDLAVLQIRAEGLEFPHFRLDEAATASPGTRVLAFSNMFKVATGDEPASVLHGVIAATTNLAARRGAFQVPYDGEVYVVDAITNNPGSGGGVLTTRDGELLGMVGKELRNSETNTWINYAVPVTELAETIGQIITGDFTPRERRPDEDENPRRYRPLDFGLVMVPDVLYRTPAYVDGVLPDSQAAEIGLLADDLVLFVNEELVQSLRMFADELGRLEAGDPLRLIVRRGRQLVPVELEVRPKPRP